MPKKEAHARKRGADLIANVLEKDGGYEKFDASFAEQELKDIKAQGELLNLHPPHIRSCRHLTPCVP